MVDTTKLDFFSGNPVDKIVAQGLTTLVNDGVTSNAPQSSKIVSATLPNPYGKKVLCRFVWSIDGTNYNSGESHLIYTYTITSGGGTTTLGGLQGAVSVGVSSSTITVRTANGYHGNVSDNGTTYSYSCNPQTFSIKYALYEVS